MKSCFLLLLFFLPTTTSYSQAPELSTVSPGMVFELLALNHDLPTAARPKYLSPCALAASPDGRYLYVAEQTAKQIAVVDLAAQTVKKNIKLPNEPTGVAVSPDGLKLYVSCSSDQWPNGMVCEVDAGAGEIFRRLPAGHGARSPVVNHAGKTLYVCNRYENSVSIIDIGSGMEDARVPSSREPYAAAITPDDSVLVVGNLLPTEISIDTLKIASKIVLIDAFERKPRDTISLPNGSHSVLGLTISPDGKFAFATHEVAEINVPLDRICCIHTNNFAIIDIKNGKLFNDLALDKEDTGSADPWGIDCTKDNTILSIVHSGSRELSIIKMQEMLVRAESKTDTIFNPGKPVIFVGLSHDFKALDSIREKMPLAIKGPRILSIVDKKAYVAGYFENTLEVIALDSSEKGKGEKLINLGFSQMVIPSREGEQAFFDGSLCFQKWRTCHSCHPFTRADGINWDLSTSIFDPRNTKSMLVPV